MATFEYTVPAWNSVPVECRRECVECRRLFDLRDQVDSDEWFYGHDCE